MSRSVSEIAAELFDRDAVHGDLPGDSQCVEEMIEACGKDPEGFLAIIRAETSDRIEVLAGFFDELATLPNGAEWLQHLEEAVNGKETKDILEQLAFAKSCLA